MEISIRKSAIYTTVFALSKNTVIRFQKKQNEVKLRQISVSQLTSLIP